MSGLLALAERQGDVGWWAILLILVGVVLLGIVRLVRDYHRAESSARIDQHISPRERQLLGDDYRDQVATYFGKRLRRERIIREITQTREDAQNE